MTKQLVLLASTSMTPLERAAGRFMRAPDHPTGGDGGDGGGGDGGAGAADNSLDPGGPSGEVNDDLDTGTPDEGTPSGTVEDDSGDGGTPPEEGGKPESTEERLARLEARLEQEARDRAYWQGRADGTIDENGNPIGQEPPQDGSIPPEDPDRPDPAKYQYGETDAGYIRDLARYEARQAFKEEQQTLEIKRQIDDVETKHRERVTSATERYPDYETLVIQGANADPATGRPKWACSPAMSLGIKTSEYGPDIAHYLASNPEESFRIAQLHPIEQAKEFGRLEYRMELANGGSENPQRRASNAPAPAPRNRGGGGGNAQVPGDTDNFSAFEQRADQHFKQTSIRPR